MSKKPVMGHNPLGSHPLAGAKLDFIPQTKSGSDADNTGEAKKTSKKVVSYYLDEDLIQEIRDRAKERDQSFSQFVGILLNKSLK